MGFLKQLSDTRCFMWQLQQLAVRMTWIVAVLWDPLAVFSHLWSCQNHWGSLTVFSWDEKMRQKEGCSIIAVQWQLNDRWAYRQALCTVWLSAQEGKGSHRSLVLWKLAAVSKLAFLLLTWYSEVDRLTHRIVISPLSFWDFGGLKKKLSPRCSFLAFFA